MLEIVTDMESTYLTKIDINARLQHILYARNSKQMQIPEGFSVPWDETLCKRAMDSDTLFSNEVPTAGRSVKRQSTGYYNLYERAGSPG